MRRLICVLILFFACHKAEAKTLILKGELSSTIQVSQRADFEVNQNLNLFKYRFALPTDYTTKISSQKVKRLDLRFSPKPLKVTDVKDKFGNNFKELYYENVGQNISVEINFEVELHSNLKAVESTAPFPLKDLPEEARLYLQPTKLVQSDDPEIIALAKRLTEKSLTLYDAVTNIINYVSDNVKYTYNPPKYDALYTLKTYSGNCQNFAHLAIALLRASHIPARIVGGISLKEPWKVPAGEGSTLVQSMGQGGHAWLEVYFPDLGWLLYDPQQSKQFTSTRHIKQTHGLDSNDINDSWQASPTLPKYEEGIEAKFTRDNIDVKLEAAESLPKGYLLSNNVKVEKRAPLQPVEERPVMPKPAPTKEKVIVFGNMNFPNLVELYNVSADGATRVFDKETAEYVTSKDIYAQAFNVEEEVAVKSISLAMHKFGGDGAVYIDLLEDEKGKPSLKGIRSNLIFLDKIPKRQGYYWVDFTFPEENQRLKKGRYWIVLRKSGEAIMNWFYIPGNPYGDGDDTRSTIKGWQWEDILNYDFVFKVTAERI